MKFLSEWIIHIVSLSMRVCSICYSVEFVFEWDKNKQLCIIFRFICRDISKIKILVPGAGLGRLTYELAYRGYYCEGNEFSLFMLVASNFVLNKCIVENQYTLYPWVHQFVNNTSRRDQVMPIAFPDVSPTKAKPKGGFNMVAGDFLQVSVHQPSHTHIISVRPTNRLTRSIFRISYRYTRRQITGTVWPHASSSTAQIILPNSSKPFTSKLHHLIWVIQYIIFKILSLQYKTKRKLRNKSFRFKNRINDRDMHVELAFEKHIY